MTMTAATATDQLLAGEGKRKLVTIRQVESVSKHPNADRLELIKIRNTGWTAVAAAGQYAVDSLVVMFEAGSVLPEQLAKTVGLPDGVTRIEPVKIRGIVSPVYICPASVLRMPESALRLALDSGADLSATLGVTKHIQPLPAEFTGDALPKDESLFSLGLVPVTDEVRLQSEPWLREQVYSDPHGWQITQKLDGTSATFAWYGKLHVCSRKLSLAEGNNIYWNYAKQHGLAEQLSTLPGNFAIQGELCGPGIRGNKLRLNEHKLFVFRVWDLNHNKPLNFSQARLVARMVGQSFVPVLHRYTSQVQLSLDELVRIADQQAWFDLPAEGIVVSNYSYTSSFKVINSNFRD